MSDFDDHLLPYIPEVVFNNQKMLFDFVVLYFYM